MTVSAFRRDNADFPTVSRAETRMLWALWERAAYLTARRDAGNAGARNQAELTALMWALSVLKNHFRNCDVRGNR